MNKPGGKYSIPKSNWQSTQPAGLTPIVDKTSTPKRADAKGKSESKLGTPKAKAKSTPKNGKQSESDKLDTKTMKRHNLTVSRNIIQMSQQSLLDYQSTYMCLGKRRRVVKPTPENLTPDTTI